jgi:N-acetylneuraminate synthase
MRNVFENLKTPYFIGEIGINHNGDINIAKKLMDAVHACNWHCAKFQKRNPDKAVPEHQKANPKDTPWGRMTYLEYKRRVEFGRAEYDTVERYAKDKPVDWTASVWDTDSLEFLLQYEVPFIKIPSAMITNKELVIAAAKTGIPLVISTGMSELSEVDTAVEWVTKHGAPPVIMHTNSSYPTPPDELNLSLIPFLKKRYGCTIGYSGHEMDLEPTVAAVVLGAEVIERHITLSHDMWGTDQKASLEVLAMDMLYKRVATVPKIIGRPEKVITASEIEPRRKLRGS